MSKKSTRDFVKRAPPITPPIYGELDRLEREARRGNMEAVKLICDVEKECKRIRYDLPPTITKKRPDPTIPTNALALKLLIQVRQIKEYGKGTDKLARDIKGLEPLTTESFSEWWKCAWSVTKDKHLRDDEMASLIDQIGMQAPSVQKRFEARKGKLKAIIREKESHAAGVSWAAVPLLYRRFSKEKTTAIKEWDRYARKQTKKAASRVWFT